MFSNITADTTRQLVYVSQIDKTTTLDSGFAVAPDFMSALRATVAELSAAVGRRPVGKEVAVMADGIRVTLSVGCGSRMVTCASGDRVFSMRQEDLLTGKFADQFQAALSTLEAATRRLAA